MHCCPPPTHTHPCRLGIEEPSWEELYGNGMGDEATPFDEYFCKPADDDDSFSGGLPEVRVLWEGGETVRRLCAEGS
jgi:hypothetical protein